MKTKTSFGSAGPVAPGTIMIKTLHGKSFYWIFTDHGTWTTLSRHTWLQAGRTITPGRTIAHKNGNTLDCSLDNLVEVSEWSATRLHNGVPVLERAAQREAKRQAKEARKQARADKKAERELALSLRVPGKPGRPKKTQEEIADRRRAYDREYYKKRRPQAERETPEQRERRREMQRQADKRRNDAKKAARQWEKQTKDNRRREEKKQLITRKVDMSALIPVKIDHKTTVYARPGQDIEAIKARYSKTKAA